MMGALYAGALRSGDPLEVVYPDGRRETVPVEIWRGPLLAADESVLARCVGPTLDVGCGPGRMAAALQARGISALGIDTDAAAVALAADNQILDPRSLLALQVNGEDLSLDHGFPARVIVPAAPGVHCTKWVRSLRLLGSGA